MRSYLQHIDHFPDIYVSRHSRWRLGSLIDDLLPAGDLRSKALRLVTPEAPRPIYFFLMNDAFVPFQLSGNRRPGASLCAARRQCLRFVSMDDDAVRGASVAG